MTVQDRPRTPVRARGPRPRGDANEPSSVPSSTVPSWCSAAFAAGLAAVVTWLLIAVPVLVAWFADTLSTVSAWQALGISSAGWAMAHRAVIDATDVSIQLTPLLLTAVPVLICRYAARHVLADRSTLGDARASRKIRGFGAAWRGVRGSELIAFTGGYAVTGLLICLISELGTAQVSFWQALPGLVLVPLSGIGLALLREHRRAENPTVARALRWLTDRIPVRARRGLAPAVEALMAMAVCSVVIVVGLGVVRADRISTLYTALDAGVVGVVVLTLAQLLLLPNLLMWAAGWMAGSEVAIGTVRVGLSETTAGELPLVPILAALPEPGALPGQFSLCVLAPLLIGGWLGIRSARSAPRLASWWIKAQVALAACAWVGVIVFGLSWLAAGSMTPGLLGTIGTSPREVTTVLCAEFLAGSLLVVSAMHVFRRRL